MIGVVSSCRVREELRVCSSMLIGHFKYSPTYLLCPEQWAQLALSTELLWALCALLIFCATFRPLKSCNQSDPVSNRARLSPHKCWPLKPLSSDHWSLSTIFGATTDPKLAIVLPLQAYHVFVPRPLVSDEIYDQFTPTRPSNCNGQVRQSSSPLGGLSVLTNLFYGANLGCTNVRRSPFC